MTPAELIAGALEEIDKAAAALRSCNLAGALRAINKARALVRAALQINRWPD